MFLKEPGDGNVDVNFETQRTNVPPRSVKVTGSAAIMQVNNEDGKHSLAGLIDILGLWYAVQSGF